MLIDRRIYLVRLDLDDVNIVKVLSQLSLTDPLSNSSEEVDIRRVCHCDGLLLCTTMDERLVVYNPCSGEASRIIKPENFKCSNTYALGKSSCNNEYKILRVCHSGDGMCFPCLVKYEIYDFTSNSWRLVGESIGWTIPGPYRHGGTSVDGNTYWLSRDFNQDCPNMANSLRCFDFSSERFGCVSLPVDHASYNLFALSVTREEQKLCLFTSRVKMYHIIKIWMATKIKSTGDMSWSNLLTVKQTLPLYNGMSFLAGREKKVIVCPTKDKNSNACLHFVGMDKYRKVEHHDVGSESSLPVSLHITLVQIQQGSLGLGTWKAPIT